jgi:serine/threonine protein kinase
VSVEIFISSVVICLVVGMKYLRSLGLFHSCLKPSNILFDENGYPVIGDTCNGFFYDVCQMKYSYSMLQ